MKNIFKNLGLFVLAVLVAYIASPLLGELYNKVFKQYGTYVDLRMLSGLPLAYIFSLIFLFTAFGDTKKYWWIGFALIPAVLFEVAFDLRHIYFPIAIGLVAYALGRGIELAIKKFRKV